MLAFARRYRTQGRLAILGLYLVVALITPLVHHDVACHVQSKSHCDACASHATASGVESSVVVSGHAGPVELCVPGDVIARAHADLPASPGRAPPPVAATV